MDAVDPLRAARPEGEEGCSRAKGGESQDDGYETSNSGEARRAPAPGSPPPAPPEPGPAPASPPPEPEPEPEHEHEAPPPASPPPAPAPPALPAHAPPPAHEYEPLMRHYASPYRQFEPQPEQEQYQHFPFPGGGGAPAGAYGFKREPDAPYDMTQHHQHQQHQYGGMQHGGHKRDEEMYNGIKRECDDPYSFVEEEAMSLMLGQHPHAHAPLGHAHAPLAHAHALPHDHHQHMMHAQQMMLNQPKKRGRKKKIKDENGMELKAEGAEGAPPRPVKERKKHDRFNGMSEEEVSRRTLPDHLADNLDIIIIGINPGLFAAYKGHHYAGPGNHFWKCLYLSGLTREQMSADEDYKLLNFGIGFTNMVQRATKGSADLTRREIKEGSAVLLDKLQTFRPKVAVFNGKLIYEVFSGKKDFCFGKQPDPVAGTNTYMWVMPSSSARCAQLPRAADKVPFYAALKKFRDYLNGLVPHVEEGELVFPDNTARRPQDELEIRRLTMEPEPGDTIILEDGTEVPLKKKRGRPKKVKLENGEVAPPAPRAPRQPRQAPASDAAADGPPKKKRGRPKKIRPEEQQFLLQQQQQQHQQQQQQQQTSAMLGGALPSMQALPHEQQQYLPVGQPAPGQYPPQMGSPLHQPPMYAMQPQQGDQSPYFQPPNAGGNMESPLDISGALGGGMSRGYASPGAGGAGGGGYGGSPRGVYASPRSQGYSPGPAAPPAPQRAQGTPQPQFPQSPAGFSAPSPPRAGAYGSPGAAARGPGAGAPGGGFSARSPLYAASPGAPGYQQPSPAPLQQQRFTQSPQYSRSPAPMPVQTQARPYSRSPAPGGGGTTPFPAASPAGGGLHSYTPSPQHTPYSQHSSPAPAPPAAPPTPSYEAHHYSGGGYGADLSSDIGAAISSPGPVSPGMAAVDFEPPRDRAAPPPDASPMGSTDMHPGSNSNSSLGDYNKTNSAGSEMSPAGVSAGGGFGPGLYEGEARLAGYPHLQHSHSPAAMDKDHYHYQQEQGGVPDSPRMEQLHQHPGMYPTSFNRATPEGEGAGFRPPEPPHTPHHQHQPGSPSEYGAPVKTKSQDVASKSLSGLESLVDQIPSIAEGPGGAAPGAPAGEAPLAAPPPALPEYAPALYPPYSAYTGAPYANNGYGAPFVGYGGGWVGSVGGAQLMRPTPGYLSEWQYGYAAAGVPAVPAGYAPSPYSAPYYNGYAGPPPAHAQQAHYLSAPPLIDLHKNGEHAGGVPSVPSVGFGGFC